MTKRFTAPKYNAEQLKRESEQRIANVCRKYDIDGALYDSQEPVPTKEQLKNLSTLLNKPEKVRITAKEELAMMQIKPSKEEHDCESNENTWVNPKDLQGAKKTPLSLVPPSALIYLGEAFREGAEKYGAYNWREKKVQLMAYNDAILRHLMAFIDGEDLDPESGKHHISGVLASAAIILDALETGNLLDNRPKKGRASALLQRFKK